MFRVCLIFYTYDSASFKSIGNNTMKKMLLATALACCAGCAQQTFTVQNKPAAVAPKETITHHFFVSGIGQKKTVDAAKICDAEDIVKTKPSKHS